MRVSSNWIQQQSVQNMMNRQSALSDLNTQFGTGKRINLPSDDPVGAARALDYTHLDAESEQFQRNIATANARLGLEDQTLGNITNVMGRVRVLALQGINGTQTDDTRKDIAAELVELRQQLLGQANSKDGHGDYLFAGNRTGSAPFAMQSGVQYLGDDGQRLVAAGPGLKIATGDAGSTVFMDVTTGNGYFAVGADPANVGTVVAGTTSITDPNLSPSAWDGGDYHIVFTAPDAYEVQDGVGTVLDSGSYDPELGGSIVFRGAQVAFSGEPVAGDSFALGQSGTQSVFATLDNMISALRSPAGAGMQNRMNAELMNLDRAMDNISRTRGAVGARMNALDQQGQLNGDLSLQYKTALTNVQDLDYYDAVSRLSQETTALEAARLTFTKVQGSKLFDYLR